MLNGLLEQTPLFVRTQELFSMQLTQQKSQTLQLARKPHSYGVETQDLL